MASAALRKAGLVAAGALLGLLLVGLAAYLYLRAAQVGQLELVLEERLQLPPEALELEEISPEGRLRIALRDVVLVDEDGDTIAAVPLASLWFDPRSLEQEGPIEFTDVLLREPDVRLVQAPDGEWNLFRALTLRASGQEVELAEEGAGRAVLLRGVEIENGRLALAIPSEPVDSASFAARLDLPTTTLGGLPYQVYRFRDLDASLPAVLLGGEEGWEAEVASLTADLAQPELRIAQLRMRAASAGEEAVRLEVDVLRFGGSELAGAGEIRFTDAGPAYDVRLQARPLAFADLQALLPTLPAEGQASFALDVRTSGEQRTELAFEELAVQAPGIDAGGRLAVALGGDAPPTFRDTQLEIARLELQALEALGLAEEVPLDGVVTGTLATVGEVEAEQGTLQVNLTARVTPPGEPDAAPSVVTAVGGVGLSEAGPRMQELRLQLEPLRLATLATLLPEQRERLRGIVRGGITVSGTPAALTYREGDLAYTVGDAAGEGATTRLTGISGEASLQPELRYRIEARAQPLALATLTELFPALPFRTATLAGPLRVTGTPERVELSADLSGAAGSIELGGTIALGEVPRFDLSGSVETFDAANVLRADLPVEGALTGTFALRGTAADLAFNVDLAQTAGRFAVQGRFLQQGDGPGLFTVAGRVTQFRLGALIGRPGLFPEPLSGLVDIRGGGAEPYRFDVDLRGAQTGVDVEGFYAAGAVPTYSVNGRVTGLNLARLPFGAALPTTDLDARIQLEGRGTTLETLAGTYALSARGSTVSGVPLDAAEIRATVGDGILRLDTLGLVLRDLRVSAEGTLGLTQPAGGRLEYRISAPNLATIPRVLMAGGIQPDLSGSLAAEGWVSGSLRSPTIAVGLRGQGLRYNQWRAQRLQLSAQIARSPALGWAGEATVTGEQLTLATGETLEEVQIEANGSQQQLAVGMVVRRDGATELALSGLLELEGRTPRGVLFETLALRYDGGAWMLDGPARLRWGGVQGVAIENLLLRRTDGRPGLIQVDGTLPPTGTADLLVRAQDVQLGALRRLVANAPEIEGTLALEAILEGPVSDPELSVQAAVGGLRYQGAQADSLRLSGRYDERAMAVSGLVWEGGQRLADIEAEIPMVLTLTDLLPSFELLRDQPLFAQALVDSLDVALLAAAVPQIADGEGRLSAQTTVRGTLDSPVLQGWAQLDGGAARVVPLGVRYERIAARLFLEENAVVIDTLSAYSDGLVTASGTIRFPRGAGADVYLLGNFNSFQVMDLEDAASVQVSGQLALSGQLPGMVLSGAVTVLESNFTIPEIDEPAGTEIIDADVGQIGADTLQVAPAGTELLAGLRINELSVTVGEDVWLVSEDARIQIGGDLLLNEVSDELRVFGALQALRGTYALEIGPLTREFEIVRGQVQFFGTSDLNPELDILAANRIRTAQGGTAQPITVLVNITGTVQFPRIQLTSDTRPPLPESEILSLLLFGRPSFELGSEARTLAQGVLAQEALVTAFATPLERILLQTGVIDYVNVRSGLVDNLGLGTIQQGLQATRVEVGTELSDNVFWTVECGIGAVFGGGSTACGTRLQFDLGRNFTASAAYEPLWQDRLLQILSTSDAVEYQGSVQLRRRWEFGISDSADSPLFPAVDP